MRRVTRVGALAAVALVAVGCDAHGGGWIESSAGEGRAIFGFTLHCEEGTFPNTTSPAIVTRGQLEWDDDPADVRFHANLRNFIFAEALPATSCEELAAEFSGHAEAVGLYRPQPEETPADEGTVHLMIENGGEAGLDGDRICVDPLSGRYAAYAHCGVVQGGNIVVD